MRNDGSFTIKIGSLMISSGYYFGWKNGKRYESYNTMFLNKFAEKPVSDKIGTGIRYAFDVVVTSEVEDVPYAKLYVNYYESEKTIIFEQNFDEILTGATHGKEELKSFGRLENGFPTINVPESSTGYFVFGD